MSITAKVITAAVISLLILIGACLWQLRKSKAVKPPAIPQPRPFGAALESVDSQKPE